MFRDFFKNSGRNAIAVYRGYNLLWHALAAALTFCIVLSGFDWWFYEATRGAYWKPVVYGAGLSGFFVPVLLPLGIYIYGQITGKARFRRAGAAALQAVVIAWLITALYKTFTGRMHPELVTTLIDNSRDFNFGFFRNGIFWGWPSSHTAVAWAMASALAPFSYARTKVLLYAYALFIAIGAGIGFHWFSDVVAGAIVGSLVGSIVAASFIRN